MPVARWKVAAVPFAVLAVTSPLSCGHPATPDQVSSTVPAGACEELRSGDFSTLALGTPAAPGENMRFLLTRSAVLARNALAMEKELIDACAELGMAAGIAEADLRAAPDAGRGAEKVCGIAANKVAEMLRKAKAAKLVFEVRSDPTLCFVDATAARKCLGDCGAPARGDMRAECVGGELVGTCQGRCASKCSFPAGKGSGTCNAVCTGRCDRDFRGLCRGNCTGSCDGQALKASGPCGGVCEGTCSDTAQGLCGGRCDGECSGFWQRPSTTCSGVCMGGCGGEVASPFCTGEYAPPGADPVCKAACGATSVLGVQCDYAQVQVVLKSGRPAPEMVRLLYGVEMVVPKILRQQAIAKKLTRALQVAMGASGDWSSTFTTVGQKPFFCIRGSIDAMKEAASGIETLLRGSEAVASAIKTDPLPP